ncbi:twin-arginine translocase subunit TatC [Mangrovibacterium diazotrophicum]|uniref:Sec-independent protein translocase protein TatC n=1 Tax=Mangrovibacterium diazotrophicum TaxID=1261403 RepID=A0A419W8D5_9BACT|nr:twin-arginine translocase subunit TatC [Mangrovibacterium diazotrophicum]RKD91700.1 sec-independent protein translocase protein TatC [Mangrovibacterium diazotrophicum]
MAEEQSTKKRVKEKVEEVEMSFLEHLEVLRWHLIRAFASIFIFSILAFINKDIIFDKIIMSPKMPDFWTNRMFAKLADFTGADSLRINTTELKLISISMAGQFMTHIWTSIIAGVIIAAPYVIWEFWRFIKPALYDTERKHSVGAVFYMTFLFLTGVLFGYYLIVPLSVHFLGSYSISGEVANQINVLSYISTVSSITIASGVIFELPVFVYFLSKVGILSPQLMKKYRRHAYVLLLIISAIITPPDVFSQIMVCLPLVFLYEVGIIISKRVQKKANAAMNAA